MTEHDERGPEFTFVRIPVQEVLRLREEIVAAFRNLLPDFDSLPQAKPSKITRRVARGVAWLDLVFGDVPWHAQVDLGRLDQDFTGDCVLGQLSPGGMGYSSWEREKGEKWVARHGFAIKSCGDHTHEECARRSKKLTRQWKRVIEARRVAG